jgi:hypothetical protein
MGAGAMRRRARGLERGSNDVPSGHASPGPQAVPLPSHPGAPGVRRLSKKECSRKARRRPSNTGMWAYSALGLKTCLGGGVGRLRGEVGLTLPHGARSAQLLHAGTE